MKFIVAIIMLSSVNLFAADLANGKKVWKKVNCALCHGPKGLGKVKEIEKIKALKAPRIAGLDAAYIEQQVLMIQGKKRKSKYTAMMMTKIKKLTPADIKDIAAYVSKMGGESYKSAYGDKFTK